MAPGRVLWSIETPHDPLTIVRDFYLLIEALEGGLEPASVDWKAYKSRCQQALTDGNVWGFDENTNSGNEEKVKL